MTMFLHLLTLLLPQANMASFSSSSLLSSMPVPHCSSITYHTGFMYAERFSPFQSALLDKLKDIALQDDNITVSFLQEELELKFNDNLALLNSSCQAGDTTFVGDKEYDCSVLDFLVADYCPSPEYVYIPFSLICLDISTCVFILIILILTYEYIFAIRNGMPVCLYSIQTLPTGGVYAALASHVPFGGQTESQDQVSASRCHYLPRSRTVTSWCLLPRKWHYWTTNTEAIPRRQTGALQSGTAG